VKHGGFEMVGAAFYVFDRFLLDFSLKINNVLSTFYLYCKITNVPWGLLSVIMCLVPVFVFISCFNGTTENNKYMQFKMI